jgi:hypothetical protein
MWGSMLVFLALHAYIKIALLQKASTRIKETPQKISPRSFNVTALTYFNSSLNTTTTATATTTTSTRTTSPYKAKEESLFLSSTSPRLCRKPHVFFGEENDDHENDQKTLTSTTTNEKHNPSMIMTYQCGGEEYDTLGRRIVTLHQTLATQKNNTTQQHFGRRDIPIPGQNKSILFIGNSHTRQQVETFLCQYSHLIDPESAFIPKGDGSEGKVYFKESHHTIQWVTNNFATYGEDWKNKLERVIRKPLTEHDAIVVGAFNRIEDRNNHTTFYRNMRMEFAKTSSSPVTTADLNALQPPSIEDVAKVYDGILMGVGMYAQNGFRRAQRMSRGVQHLSDAGRGNIAYLDGRQYITEVGEGGGLTMLGVSVCENSELGQNLHRCTGPNGGIVDVTIWDLVELFYRFL